MPKPNPAFEERLRELSDGHRSYAELARLTGKSPAHVADTVRRLDLPRAKRGSGRKRQPSRANQARIAEIQRLADGQTSSAEIAAAVGSTEKYVQRILNRYDLPRMRQSGPPGSRNGFYAGGRSVDLDGYALVRVPKDHPEAHQSRTARYARAYEHRVVAAQALGRDLAPGEVVDHIDGYQLHNHPDNLRVFPSNRDHLRATISGQVPAWSDGARAKQFVGNRQRKALPRIDTYRAARERGDVRLRQILLSWLRFEEDSFYLSGTRRWLERSGIFDTSRPNLERHLRALEARYKSSP